MVKTSRLFYEFPEHIIANNISNNSNDDVTGVWHFWHDLWLRNPWEGHSRGMAWWDYIDVDCWWYVYDLEMETTNFIVKKLF